MPSDHDYAALAHAKGDKSPNVTQLVREAIELDYAISRGEYRIHTDTGGTGLIKVDHPEIKPENLGRCCLKATMTNCCCVASWTCSEHGDRHVGSHD